MMASIRIQSNSYFIFLCFCLIFNAYSITKQCQVKSNQAKSFIPQIFIDNSCPQNSVCNQDKYCVCQKGYFGNCQNAAFYINQTLSSFTISENITYFIIQPTLDVYVYYQFTLCNQEGQNNMQALNLWADDGSLQTPNSQNALGVDKNLRVIEGCTSLMTPFFTFSTQPNGQKQQLIFGIKLLNAGTLKINLLVQESQLFGFEILLRIILILVGGITVISLGGIFYCVYRCRRNGRRNVLIEQKNDIKFFDEYMPSKKTEKDELKQEICSVCLGEFKETEEVRRTVCEHNFHKTCLDEWCVANLSCPICRTSFQKGNLIHYSYIKSRRQSTSINNDSVIEDDSIIGNSNLRSPMV